MLLSTLYWPDEVRSVADLDLPDEQFEFKPAEKAMAQQLVQAMTGEFDPAEYHDEYREALMSVIQAKIDGQPVEAPEPVVETRGLTDLMAVLEASVAAARSGRAATPAVAQAVTEEPTSVAAVRKARAATSSSAGVAPRQAAPVRSPPRRRRRPRPADQPRTPRRQRRHPPRPSASASPPSSSWPAPPAGHPASCPLSFGRGSCARRRAWVGAAIPPRRDGPELGPGPFR